MYTHININPPFPPIFRYGDAYVDAKEAAAKAAILAETERIEADIKEQLVINFISIYRLRFRLIIVVYGMTIVRTYASIMAAILAETERIEADIKEQLVILFLSHNTPNNVYASG